MRVFGTEVVSPTAPPASLLRVIKQHGCPHLPPLVCSDQRIAAGHAYGWCMRVSCRPRCDFPRAHPNARIQRMAQKTSSCHRALLGDDRQLCLNIDHVSIACVVLRDTAVRAGLNTLAMFLLCLGTWLKHGQHRDREMGYARAGVWGPRIRR